MSAHEVVVVGAGAAGLWAAEVAARGGADVFVLEKTPRTGTKVLASGGSRCNLTTTLDARHAARWFRRAGERFLGPALAALPPAEVRARFEAWGVPTVEAPLEKVFPASQSAKDVRDALEGAARGAGAQIRLSAPVSGVQPDGAGWSVLLEDGSAVQAAHVVLACGGRSFAGSGTTGDGYAWLRALDLPLVETTPALAPLTSPASWVHDLTGIAVPDAVVRLVDAAGRELMVRTRPILFTHRGVSGPGAMDLSVHVGRATAQLELRVDLAADEEREALRTRLIELASASGTPQLGRAFPDLPKRLLAAVAAQAALDPRTPIARLDKAARHRVIEAVKGLAIPVDGTEGFPKAEVTAGGLDLKAVNPRTMEVNAWPGLYVVGELLDLDGPIGGFSFLAAFATAELAGRAVAPR